MKAGLGASLHPGLLRDMLGWDVLNWREALLLWERELPADLSGWRGLEIGAARGGLSLYFGLRGVQMICSDRHDPRSLAAPLLARYGVEAEFRALDAWQPLPFADASLDLVCFKSVLGGLRKGAGRDPKPELLAEIRRVLKPGGWLLLAENLQGHALHGQLRRHFVRWSAGWEYLDLNQLLQLLEPFDLSYRSHGLLALLGRSESQRRGLGRLDAWLAPSVPARWHYLFAGAARKPDDSHDLRRTP